MSLPPERPDLDVSSLSKEWQHQLKSNPSVTHPSEEERAEALREYQRLVRKIDEVLREQEAENRTGGRTDR
jgi:hypothetical protein